MLASRCRLLSASACDTSIAVPTQLLGRLLGLLGLLLRQFRLVLRLGLQFRLDGRLQLRAELIELIRVIIDLSHRRPATG
jgi:hypothetical protein